jgi:hypothetical protein
MPSDSIGTDLSEVSLKSLKLRSGMHLQIRPAKNSAEWVEAQFLAALPGKGIMTAPHNGDYQVKSGEDFSIRGFTGQYDFQFASRVMQTFTDPFTYVLLAYPDKVEARAVRKAMRMKALLPARAKPHDQEDSFTVILIDLSVAGALIRSPQSLGNTGDQIDLNFALDVENSTVELRLAAQIAHSAEGTDGVRVGLMFKSLEQNDRLALHCFAMASAEESATH